MSNSTTRSGRRFKDIIGEMTSGVSEGGTTDLVRVLLEDRQRQEQERTQRDEQLLQERQLREEQEARRVEQLAAERERREEEHRLQLTQMQGQMEAMRGWLERSMAREEERLGRATQDQLKLTKLLESEDIESYLTTFERMMQVYHVDEERWAFKLAPQLTGRAQQAYAAMRAEDAADYRLVITAILHRYNISEETYRRRFRTARKKEGETFGEMAVRLSDLAKKWMTECDTVEAVLEKLVVEQLVNTMTTDLKVWVSERKPTTGGEAGGLADDYVRARQRDTGVKGTVDDRRREKGMDQKKCHNCGKEGHFARNCFKKTGDKQKSDVKTEGGRWDLSSVKCYNCGQLGHISTKCPAKVLFCGGSLAKQATRSGVVEGQIVEDIVLDTGCSRTMVHSSLVGEGKQLDGEAVTVRCAHGDTVLYPLAKIDLELDGVNVSVKAAVADKLPASVLLGTDVPELGRLLRVNPMAIHSEVVEEALVVRTRAQTKKEEAEEAMRVTKEKESGVQAKPLEEELLEMESDDGTEVIGGTFDSDLFMEGNVKVKQTRDQKRKERRKHGLVRAKDRSKTKQVNSEGELTMDGEELRRLQNDDDTLTSVRKTAAGKTDSEPDGTGFFERDGLLYRRWVPVGECMERHRDQIVLPKKCRLTVLHLAHTIPFAGHLGKKKTAMKVLNRFYWPTLFRDVADYCRSCPECQKCTRRRVPRAPMIPIPSVTVPFERIAMDLIGPLPRSRSGNRYVLVVCDYGTRYPEAVPLKSIDAEHIAEELVKMFARVGIPKEILTDQGSNFTSQLLAELYRLLHVKALRTSPYHPQTDGLVERFNQTLKGMLRKNATEDGKDWDALIPFVLFAYREVPQESTGFSPFELMYGREVRGPLDVLKETWESSTKSDESILSHVMLMRERMEKMTELVQTNLDEAQHRQKQWYDRFARQRQLQADDHVLVLLPTTTSKLTAKWQGPYRVIKPVGKVNYLIDMCDRRKRKRVFHINLLKKWCIPTSTGYFTQDVIYRESNRG